MQENSSIPVIIGGFGISHIFVDERRSGALAGGHRQRQVQRPSACNASTACWCMRRSPRPAAAAGGLNERAQGGPGRYSRGHAAADGRRQPACRRPGRLRYRVALADPGDQAGGGCERGAGPYARAQRRPLRCHPHQRSGQCRAVRQQGRFGGGLRQRFHPLHRRWPVRAGRRGGGLDRCCMPAAPWG
ncbi:hypothetical protein H2136_08555 [Aeromonas hydrophila]|uniref:Uncharacterized protein n=1 Tax=Aeromonas hydrophila TaxID=644 RepID=A0A926IY41_AERHY|nr:hypothetical protein [Aeromonas hydrophila]